MWNGHFFLAQVSVNSDEAQHIYYIFLHWYWPTIASLCWADLKRLSRGIVNETITTYSQFVLKNSWRRTITRKDRTIQLIPLSMLSYYLRHHYRRTNPNMRSHLYDKNPGNLLPVDSDRVSSLPYQWDDHINCFLLGGMPLIHERFCRISVDLLRSLVHWFVNDSRGRKHCVDCCLQSFLTLTRGRCLDEELVEVS